MSVKLLEHAKVQASVLQDTEQRQIDFYAAAFSTEPDKHGDRIEPHAFDDWLERFYKAGAPLPISYSHAAFLNDERDPFDIVGYAPADPQHVFADDYGLRIKGFLETGTNDKAQQVFSLAKRGVLKAASLVFDTLLKDERKLKDGSTLITQVLNVRDVGPCLEGANDGAYVVSVKTADAESIAKAVDATAWDGNRAMGMCSSAAEYRSICAAEHTIGQPDERQHWALPHHYLGGGPNADGVRAALSRVPQTQNITDAERSSGQAHLEAHMNAISPPAAKSSDMFIEVNPGVVESDTGTYTVTTTIKHAAAPNHLQTAHDALVRAGAVCKTEASVAKTDDATDTRSKANEEEGSRPNSEEPEISELRRWLTAHAAEPVKG